MEKISRKMRNKKENPKNLIQPLNAKIIFEDVLVAIYLTEYTRYKIRYIVKRIPAYLM